MFSIRIHHGGRFHKYPGIRYVDGHVDIFDMVDIDLPLTSLDERLYSLACEEDIHCLATLVRSFKLIKVYIEHDVTAVDSDRRPTRVRATIEDITDEPSSITAIKHKSRKMLLLTWHDSSEPTKELVYDSVTPRSLPQHDSSTPCKDSICESITPRCMPHFMLTPPTDESVVEDVMRKLPFEKTKLDGEAGFGDVTCSGIDSYGLSHDESFVVDDLDLNLNEPIVEEVRTQEPIVKEVRTQEPIVEEVIVEDYVSFGEDAEQGNGKEDESAPSDGQFFYDVEGIYSAYETQYDVQSSEDAGTNDDDDDDDFLVDEENEIVEPNVDVHLFSISMNVLFENIGVTNLVPDDVLEGKDMDVINADGFDSDPGNDNETSNYRRRRLAELSREMEGVINASGQWKYSFYTGQKFTTAKEAKDIVYLHSIESRRNLKLHKNDNVR
ncbi:hypothetical protein Tco_1259533, partial [Tanacetum coccineum]